jgi:hypothetical protein
MSFDEAILAAYHARNEAATSGFSATEAALDALLETLLREGKFVTTCRPPLGEGCLSSSNLAEAVAELAAE